MFIIGGLLGGYLLGKCTSLASGFIYDMTAGRRNERKWKEFIVLYRKLKAEEEARK